jgi:hypothetical protein
LFESLEWRKESRIDEFVVATSTSAQEARRPPAYFQSLEIIEGVAMHVNLFFSGVNFTLVYLSFLVEKLIF